MLNEEALLLTLDLVGYGADPLDAMDAALDLKASLDADDAELLAA